MKLPPAVIVHGLEQARRALAPGRAVTLLSAPAAGVYAGVGWWRALVAQAVGDAAPPPHVLDCGSAPGRALEALRGGQGVLVVRVEPALFAGLAERAAAQGAVLLPAPPPALDLAHPNAARRLDEWLRGGG